MQWNDILGHNHSRSYPREIEVENEYQFHKKISSELFEVFIDYIKLRYVDRFEPYILVPNRYPYHISQKCPEIKHYLFWVNPKNKITQADAKRICEKKFIDHDVFLFENPPRFKSIPEITHYHVFVRPSAPL